MDMVDLYVVWVLLEGGCSGDSDGACALARCAG